MAISQWLLLFLCMHSCHLALLTNELDLSAPAPSACFEENPVDGQPIEELSFDYGDSINSEGIGFTEWRICSPCIVEMGVDRVDSFFRIPNNTLVHKIDSKTLGKRWENLGGLSTSDINCLQWDASHIFVYQQALNRVVVWKMWNGKEWSPWSSLPMGMLMEPPSCVLVGKGSIQCIGRSLTKNPVGALYRHGKWRRRRVPKRQLTHPLACISTAPNRADCFAEGAYKKLQYIVWKRRLGWLPWSSLGGSVDGVVSPVSTSPNRIDIFVKTTMDRVATISWDGSVWSKWGIFRMWGPKLGMDVECVASTLGRIDCFTAFLPRRYLHRISWNGRRWTKWMSYGYAIHQKPVCRYVSSGRILCYVQRYPPKWTMVSFRLFRVPILSAAVS